MERPGRPAAAVQRRVAPNVVLLGALWVWAARPVAWDAIPVGALGGGFALEEFGAVPTFAGLAVVGVAIAVGTVSGTVRHAPRVETLTPGP